MRSGRLLFALLVGLLLTVAAVGAWTATSQGASAPPGGGPGDALTAARFSISVDGHEIASFAELQGITSGYDIDFIESSGRRLAVPGKRPPPTVTLKRGMTRDSTPPTVTLKRGMTSNSSWRRGTSWR